MRSPDWGEIEARFMDGEKPAEIAKSFKTTANLISQRATKYQWTKKREEKRRETVQTSEEKRKAMREMVSAGVQFILSDIIDGLKEGRIGATTQDGEGFSSALYRDTWKEALKDHYRPDGDKLTITGGLSNELLVRFITPEK